jgi:hypothetical protein
MLGDRIKDYTLITLRSFFGGRPDFTWEADENSTNIFIGDKYSINLEAVEKKPLISLQRGIIRWGDRHIGRFYGSDLRTKDQYIARCLGSCILLCCSRVGLEAERIAQLVFHFFTMFSDKLRLKGYYDIQAIALGEERIAKSNSDIDISIVPVTINCELVDTWSVVDSTPEV